MCNLFLEKKEPVTTLPLLVVLDQSVLDTMMQRLARGMDLMVRDTRPMVLRTIRVFMTTAGTRLQV